MYASAAIEQVQARVRLRSVLVGLIGLLVMAAPGWSQTALPQPPAETSTAPASPPETTAPPDAVEPPAMPSETTPPAVRPGLIDKLGELLKDSVDGVSTNLQGAQQHIENFNKGAVDSLTRLPMTGLAIGRAACLRSDNGAPDCRTASDDLCKTKGYNSGRSLDTESAQNCSPKVYMPGYERKEGDCKLETYVTRAACQ
jgi:hypothetical protein